ncbi:MAG: L-threonylcarbamoyladenylate synthase [Patescibacteria group bacterium]
MKAKNIDILKSGGIGVILTDTIYGILGSALNPKTVERIYEVKGRNKNKPLIILISQLSDLRVFNIKLSLEIKKILSEYWPGKISIILPVSRKEFEYLHRGTKSLAFRFPKNKRLISLLEKTGPLVAPSANPQGKDPAKSIAEAKEYFGEKVDFYEEGKLKESKPSILIKVVGNSVEVIRK